MKLVTASLFSRLPAQLCIFAFAALWTLLLPGRNVQAGPLELQASLVQEGQSREGCVSFAVQGSNFSFFGGVYPAYCDGLQPLFPGETLESSVFLSPGDPLFTLGWEGSGSINVPENPGRVAILSGGSIAAYGPLVTVPQDAMGVLQFKVPISVTGTLPACLLPANDTGYPICDPNYLHFADVNIAVSGFDVVNLDCGEVDFLTLCTYTQDFTGSAVPEPVNMAAIGVMGFAALFVYVGRRISSIND